MGLQTFLTIIPATTADYLKVELSRNMSTSWLQQAYGKRTLIKLGILSSFEVLVRHA